MDFGTIGEVALGLFFVYYIFALIASAIAGQIGNFLNIKASTLKTGLIDLLGSSTANNVLANSLVQPLKPIADWGFLLPALYSKGNNKVEKIPTSTFTKALFDVIKPGGIADRTEAGIIQAITDSQMIDDELRQTLLTLIQTTDGRIESIEKSIEGWYDNKRTQISELYRKHIKLIVMLISALTILLVQIDTLAIVNSLEDNPSLRQATLSQLDAALAEDPSSADEGGSARNYVESLTDMGMPIAYWWTGKTPDGSTTRTQILGMLISWFAISQGAPFWYNILKSIRGSESSSSSDSTTASSNSN